MTQVLHFETSTFREILSILALKMSNILESIDHQLFQWINHDWTHPVLDLFFVNITDLHKTLVFKVVLLPILLALLFWKARMRGFKILLILILTLATGDLVGSKILKASFARLRPSLAGVSVVQRSEHFSGESFPSNHAINMFALATLLGGIFLAARKPLFILAGLVAYSRVYCGVHFPADVVGGALFGILWGYLGLWAYRRWR